MYEAIKRALKLRKREICLPHIDDLTRNSSFSLGRLFF